MGVGSARQTSQRKILNRFSPWPTKAEDIEEEGIPRQRVLNNPDSPIKEMLAPRGSFSNELTTYLQWAGVVALFVLLVVFLATGTPPAAPDRALAD